MSYPKPTHFGQMAVIYKLVRAGQTCLHNGSLKVSLIQRAVGYAARWANSAHI